MAHNRPPYKGDQILQDLLKRGIGNIYTLILPDLFDLTKSKTGLKSAGLGIFGTCLLDDWMRFRSVEIPNEFAYGNWCMTSVQRSSALANFGRKSSIKEPAHPHSLEKAEL